MKYTAKDIEKMLGPRNKLPTQPTNKVRKYTADDVAKMLDRQKRPEIKEYAIENTHVNPAISLPTKEEAEKNKANLFLKTAGYRGAAEVTNTADALTYLKQYKMADNADKLDKRNELRTSVTPRQRMYAKAAGMIDKDNLINQSDTTKKLLIKAAESEIKLKEGTGPVANTLIDIGLAGTDMLSKIGASALTHIPLPVMIGITSGAERFQEDINQGKDIDLALKSGVGSGVISGGIESLTGIGASKLSKTLGTKAGSKLLSKMPANINKYLSKANDSVVGKILKNAAGEGIEEGLEYDAQRVYRNLLMDEETPREIKDQAYSMLIGAGVGGLFGGAQSLGNAFSLQNNTQSNIDSDMQQTSVKTQNKGLIQEKQIPQVMTSESIQNNEINQQAMTTEGDTDVISIEQPEVKEINTKSKAERYQNRQEKYFIQEISEALGISKFADRSGLKTQVAELANDIKNGTASPEKIDTLFKTILDDGIQIDLSFYNQYKPLKDSIRNSKIYVSEQVKSDFAKGEYNNFRKTNLKNLNLTNEGVPVDVYYAELSDSNPDLFPDNIINPADQLKRIAEVQNSIVATENNLNMYIDDSGVFEQAARLDFDKAIDKLTKEARQVKKVEDEKIAKLEAKEIDRESVKNTTAESMRQIYDLRNQYQKEYDKVLNKEILTDRDKVFLDWMIKGEITVKDLPNNVNKKGIVKVYEAKLPLENLKKTVRDYNKAHKSFLREEADMLIENSPSWKEKKSGFQYQRETMERNIRDIVPDKKEAADIVNTYFTPVHENEALSTKFKNEYRDRVKKLNLSDKAQYEVMYEAEKGGLPVHEEVSERALVQLLGENVISKDMVKQSGADVVKIEKAVKEFRDIYNNLIDKANDALIENGYAPVDYRKDYFPHFQDNAMDNLLGKIGRMIGLDVNTKELPTDIAGITHIFKPGKKWVGNFLQRTTNETVYDAVEGFDRYIEGVSDVIHHTRDIQRLRAFEESIRYMHSSEGIKAEVDKIRENPNMAEEDKINRIEELYKIDKNKFPYLVTELRNYTDNLAGKKSIQDRTMEHRLGRGMYEISKSMENRVAANMVALNPGSWITNFIPLAQGLGGVKTKTMFNGMKDTITSYGKNDGFIDKSTFLTNRYGSEPLVMTKTRRLSSKLASPMMIIDNFTAESLVRARYYENMSKGMTEIEAMRDADKWTAGVMADRSKGSLPTIFNERNPVTKTMTMFQTEVNNQLSYMFKDIPDEMKEQGAAAIAYALMRVFVASFLYNELYEKLTGRRSAFDPIDIVKTAVSDFTDEDKTTYQAISNTAKNIAEDVPFVGGLIGGGRIPISSAIPNIPNTVKGATGLATGEMDTKKALSVLGKEMAKPASYLALPVGGGQVKKAVEGISAVKKGGSFGVDSQGRDTLQFPVEKTAGNYIQGAVFGKYALPRAKDYVDSGFKQLSANLTDSYKDALKNGFTIDEFLDTYQAQKKATSDKDKEGKTIPLSLAKNKKKIIDEVNPGMSKKKLEMLYEYFDVSEKVWKPEEKKSTLPTIKGITFNTKLPTIKE